MSFTVFLFRLFPDCIILIIGGDNVKILVCENKHCRNNHGEQLLAKLKTTGVEFAHSACMDMCDSGPNIFTFPDLKMYGNVTIEKLDDIISGNNKIQPYNEEIYNLEINKEYRDNPMHKRTVKLFRWHLEKHDDFSVLELNNSINIFKNKRSQWLNMLNNYLQM